MAFYWISSILVVLYNLHWSYGWISGTRNGMERLTSPGSWILLLIVSRKRKVHCIVWRKNLLPLKIIWLEFTFSFFGFSLSPVFHTIGTLCRTRLCLLKLVVCPERMRFKDLIKQDSLFGLLMAYIYILFKFLLSLWNAVFVWEVFHKHVISAWNSALFSLELH